jgi:hypothetical protein
MSNDLWGEDDVFSDIPTGAQTGKDGRPVQDFEYAPSVQPQVRRQAPTPPAPPKEVAPPILEVEEEVFEETEEDDFSEVLSDAGLRLEQGNLYRLIMNHNLFEGQDADPKAIQNVQKEIRKFAKERMEIMLGMRPEFTPEAAVVSSPFNDLEVQILKTLASRATNGATETEEANQVATVLKQTPKRSLNPIGAQPKKAVPKVVTKPAPRPLQSQPAAPLKRTKQQQTIEQIAREVGIPVELLEIDVPGIGGKSIHEMTDSERDARNKLVAQRRQQQVKSSHAIPMASEEQQVMMAMERANQFSNSLANSPVANLLDIVKNMPIKNG